MNNDAGDDPQSWDGAVNFQDLPNWPANTSCKIMRVFKQYLIALDITVSGTRSPHTVKWSSPAVPGAVPSFWDNADTNDSNEFFLSEGGGFTIDCEPLGDLNIIYKEFHTYAMEFIGGPFVFRIYKLPFQHGILAPRCAKEFFGQHFVVTRADVIVHNGQEAVSVIDGENRDYFFSNLATGKERKTFVVPNYALNEMWICFVSNAVNGDYADEVMIYNWKEKTWGHRHLGQVGTLEGCPHIGYGLLDKSAQSVFIDDNHNFIDNENYFIDGNPFSSGKVRLVGSMVGTTNKKLVEFDTGTDEQGNAVTSFAERTGIAIVGKDRQGNPKVDVTSTKFVRRIYPKLAAGVGTINVYIGSQDRINGSVTYLPAVAFNPEIDNHIDCRIQGKAIAIKFESTTSMNWTGTGFVLDMDVIGESYR